MKLIYVEDEGSLWTAVNEINWTMKWNWIVKLIEWAAAGGPAQGNQWMNKQRNLILLNLFDLWMVCLPRREGSANQLSFSFNQINIHQFHFFNNWRIGLMVDWLKKNERVDLAKAGCFCLFLELVGYGRGTRQWLRQEEKTKTKSNPSAIQL